MNADALKSQEQRETARHNREMEEAEFMKARAAKHTALAKVADAAVKGATGLASLAGRNDPKWRLTGDPFLDTASNVSYVQLDKDTKYLPGALKQKATHILHGFEIMFGRAKGFSMSPFYLAMKRIYDIQRGKNRGATNYTVGDTIQYYFPLMSIAVQIAHLQKMIKIAKHPELKSRATIQNMLRTMGVNAEDFYANIANLETRLQRLISVLNECPLPADLPVLKRWIWLASYVFKDSMEQNFTSIILAPLHFYSTNTSYQDYLCTPIDGFGGYTMGDDEDYTSICNMLDKMESEIYTILDNTTLQAVAGDIINAFEGKLIKWDAFTDYNDSPYIYDEEFLLQYHNAYIHKSYAGLHVTPLTVIRDVDGRVDQGYLYSTGKLADGVPFLIKASQEPFITNGKIIKPLDFDSLDNALSTMALALVVHGEVQGSLTYYYYDPDTSNLTSATFTAPSGAKVALLDTYSTEILTPGEIYMGETWMNTLDSNELTGLNIANFLSSFDVIPWLFSTINSNNYYMCELDRYALVPVEQFRTITAVANQALWGYSTLKLESSAPSKSNSAFAKGEKRSKFFKGSKPHEGGRAGTNPKQE